MDGAELIHELRTSQEEMDGLLDECQRLFGSGRVASHFRLGPMTADQWRRFHVVHGRHHMKQMKRIAREVNISPA
jgi:Protein of unknown function (DUF1569)